VNIASAFTLQLVFSSNTAYQLWSY